MLGKFGFSKELVASAPLEAASMVIRMGDPPLRIELLTGVSGVDIDACHRRPETEIVDAVEFPFVSLTDLRANKLAAGRAQVISDLEELS